MLYFFNIISFLMPLSFTHTVYYRIEPFYHNKSCKKCVQTKIKPHKRIAHADLLCIGGDDSNLSEPICSLFITFSAASSITSAEASLFSPL